MMHYGKFFRHASLCALLCALLVFCFALTGFAQEQQSSSPQTKISQTTARTSRSNDSDPFRRYKPVPPKRNKNIAARLEVPSVQERIERYKAQKLAAMNAQLPAPKPTTALLLSEVQVTGIFRTPRGYAAMVEATPIHLSYVIYPGETFFDGQLVAIEEDRLVFRHETRWTDGRRDRNVVTLPLRQANAVTDSMNAVRNPSEGQAQSSGDAGSSAHAPSQNQQAVEEAIRQNKVVVGMTKQQAIQSWGAPDDIVYTTTERGRREQWVYKNKGSIFFDNGILESFQTQ